MDPSRASSAEEAVPFQASVAVVDPFRASSVEVVALEHRPFLAWAVEEEDHLRLVVVAAVVVPFRAFVVEAGY